MNSFDIENFLLQFVRKMSKCGGLTHSRPAISEVQEICDLVTKLCFVVFVQLLVTAFL